MVNERSVTQAKETIASLNALLAEIETVYYDISPCFPPEYKIVYAYFDVIQNELKELFGEWSSLTGVDEETGKTVFIADNPTIIGLFQSVNDSYYPGLNRLGIYRENIVDLIKPLRNMEIAFRERTKEKMFEWIKNIAKEDAKSQPEKAGGRLYTKSHVDLINLMKQQIEIAETSKSSHFVFEIAFIFKSIRKIYNNCRRTIT